MKVSPMVSSVFDDPNPIGHAGLVQVLQVAQRAGLYDLVGAHLTVPSPNRWRRPAVSSPGCSAGADSVDDLDEIRHGGMGGVPEDVRAPSTLGTFLRSFTSGSLTR